MEYDPETIESRWRERWAESGRYEVDPDDGEPTFITVPYPYPSGGMHLGHARTYTVPDVYARYRRLQGDTVLFPIAWHVTGTPIVGAVERLQKREQQQLDTLTDVFRIPEDDLGRLETPMGYARYFIEEGEASYKRGMKALGLSIDWRREFTTNDERYSRFITWQYESLRDRGRLEEGLHPVKYCTNEENPVTTHDLLEGEEAEFQEYTLIRFRHGETVVPMATLRPETVRGVTNAYVHPEATYVRATVTPPEADGGDGSRDDSENGADSGNRADSKNKADTEEWLISETAVEKFRLQEHAVDVIERFEGAEFVGERVTNPVTGEEVLVLPARFVDAGNATGVVMSVPAHSPDDYVALQEAKARGEQLREFGVDPADVAAIEPVPILEIEGYGEIPARDAVETAGIESTDDPALADVTADLYQDEFHSGRLLDSYGEFAGEVVEEVREQFRDHHAGEAFDRMYEFSEEVVCRCGGRVEVARQQTWFLRYGDEDWKALAHEAVDRLTCIPESTREQYDHTIDWLDAWPCIRNYGLGTRLPWDEEFVIEPLSDSTIYMAYYTIAHRIADVPVEDLDRTFFDTLFYGRAAVESGDVPGTSGPREVSERALDLREEFTHWYPVDVRCSANDLIRNHLTFFLFHHAELFAKDEWPRGITVMGMGLLEGQSMSSSRGHVKLPGDAIDTYGADTVRFFLLNSAEPWQDYDWRGDLVGTTRRQLERFWNRAQEVIDRDDSDGASDRNDSDGAVETGEADLEHVDEWLLSKLQSTIRETTASLDEFETRSASQTVFYQFDEHLRWYRRRADLDRPGARWALREVLSVRLRLLAPFVPFLANDLHEQLTGEPADDAGWPDVDSELESPRVEASEQLVADVTDDVNDIIDVTGTDPETIRLTVAADWKYEVFETVRDVGPDVGAVMGEVMTDDRLRERGDEVNDLVQDLVEFVRGRGDDRLAALSEVDERAVYEDAAAFLEREFDATVEVFDAESAPGEAHDAVPFRPGVHLA